MKYIVENKPNSINEEESSGLFFDREKFLHQWRHLSFYKDHDSPLCTENVIAQLQYFIGFAKNQIQPPEDQPNSIIQGMQYDNETRYISIGDINTGMGTIFYMFENLVDNTFLLRSNTNHYVFLGNYGGMGALSLETLLFVLLLKIKNQACITLLRGNQETRERAILDGFFTELNFLYGTEVNPHETIQYFLDAKDVFERRLKEKELNDKERNNDTDYNKDFEVEKFFDILILQKTIECFSLMPSVLFLYDIEKDNAVLYSHGLFEKTYDPHELYKQITKQKKFENIYHFFDNNPEQSLFLWGEYFPDTSENPLLFKESISFWNTPIAPGGENLIIDKGEYKIERILINYFNESELEQWDWGTYYQKKKNYLCSNDLKEYAKKNNISHFFSAYRIIPAYLGFSIFLCASYFHYIFNFQSCFLVLHGRCCDSGFAQSEEKHFNQTGFIFTSLIHYLGQDGIEAEVLPNIQTTTVETRQRFVDIYRYYLKLHFEKIKFPKTKLNTNLLSEKNSIPRFVRTSENGLFYLKPTIFNHLKLLFKTYAEQNNLRMGDNNKLQSVKNATDEQLNDFLLNWYATTKERKIVARYDGHGLLCTTSKIQL